MTYAHTKKAIRNFLCACCFYSASLHAQSLSLENAAADTNHTMQVQQDVPPETLAAETDASLPPSSEDIEFNQHFLPDTGNDTTLDVSRFSHSNVMMPGVYGSDIYVNAHWVGKTDVVFRDVQGEGKTALACFDQRLLDMSGVDLGKLPESALDTIITAGNNQCVQLSTVIPDATLSYDANALRLDMAFPQALLAHHARGYISPQFWDAGVNAAMVGYNANMYRSSSMAGNTHTWYVGLNNGINVGDWHIRNMGSFTQKNRESVRYQNTATYVQHDIVPWHSQLLMGDSFTLGQLFDSLAFRGLRVMSDDRMLPDSQVGYAPVIRGIAKTNAHVRVMQNGMLLYDMPVAPGPFEINDLYATGYAGDLHVHVREADGQEHVFVVPNVAFAPLLRPGHHRYSVTVGKVRNADVQRAYFMEAIAGKGISNNVTLNAGMLAAHHYLAGSIGAAWNTPVGAFSVEAIHARATVNAQHKKGNSVQFKYYKQFLHTNTTLTFAAYHYANKDYMRLQEAMAQSRDRETFYHQADSDIQAEFLRRLSVEGRADDDMALPVAHHQRHRLQLSVNQSFGDNGGTFFASAALQTQWGTDNRYHQYALGYSNMVGNVSYSIALQRQHAPMAGKADVQLYAALMMPLGKDFHAPTMTASHQANSAGQGALMTVSGTIPDTPWSYGVSAARGTSGAMGGAVSGQYRGPYAMINGGYSRSAAYTQSSVVMSGGAVVHAGGVTLSQSLGESIGIVEAKDAAGAHVNTSGVHVDRFGYAVVPFLTPYRMNQVDIDPKGLSMDVELSATSQHVSPHAGAVVLLKYPTVSGRAVLIDTTMEHGGTPPFGAEVRDRAGNHVGLAGQGGRVFVRGLSQDAGELVVQWGGTAEQECILSYHLPPRQTKDASVILEQTTGICMTRDAPMGDVQMQTPVQTQEQHP